MSEEIHEDDVGTRFQITVMDDGSTVDLTNASVRQLTFRKPDGTTFSRTASIFGDGSESSGVMYYDSVSGDLDTPGRWKIQGKVSLTSGTYFTNVADFQVECNI